MGFTIDGREIAITASGFLEDLEDWSTDLADRVAAEDELELTDCHWDVLNYLRDEYVNNAGNQPNTRTLVKAMSRIWSDKSINAKTLYDLFPGDPSKLRW
jgi:tRNA 2-thiouridine synthesizing protein E